ncbi:MAG: LemA family protein [Bacteroidales bacterium]
MNKGCMISLIIGGIFLFIAIAFVGWGVSAYNKMVTMDESVKAQWGNVQNQYQRRSDLIPNLVNTVKGYATHEKTTLEQVTEARAKATQVTIDPQKLDAQSLQRFQAAQGELSQALGRLLMVQERYPDLKANQNFIELQAQLEGTENRISTERTRFNDEAKTYNSYIRTFPQSLVAGIGGFSQMPYFEAEQSAQKAPKVEF